MPTPAELQAASQFQTGLSGESGYLSPFQLLGTSQGQNWLDDLYNKYYGGMQAGEAGYGMPGTEYLGANGEVSQYSDPNLRSILTSVIQNPSYNPGLYDWIMQQGGMPEVPTLARDSLTAQTDIAAKADQLARDLDASRNQSQMDLAKFNAGLQRDLLNGQINGDILIQKMRDASAAALQKEELGYKYAELAWTKEYGSANLQILRDRLKLDYDRLGLDREVAQWQKDNDTRRVAVEEGRLGLERDKFGLDKNIQEAMLRANPYNAVANALYTRGAGVPAGQTEFGQPTTTLDNSGTLPFLQSLMNGQGIQPLSGGGGMFMNQGGIGGNQAPRPNQISQLSAGNMSEAEKGITTSLAQYGGWDPNDYWKTAQNSWNTAGQKSMDFGGTRLG